MFADSGLSDELAEKIVAFVDREAGRDAPLTADDEAMVRRLIDEDPAVRALVDELRATNAGLDTLLDDVAAVEVPDRLVALIRGHGTSDVAVMTPASDERAGAEGGAAPGEGEVVTLGAPGQRRFSYGPLAAAASVAVLISSGALFYIYNDAHTERTRLQAVLASATEQAEIRGRELADARAELSRLAGIAEQASSQRQATADRLLANEDSLQQLQVERAALEGRYAALEDEHQRLRERLEQQRAEIADGEVARDQTTKDLADARQALTEAESQSQDQQQALTARVEDLTGELERREQRIASLSGELEAGKASATSAQTELAGLLDKQVELERRLAAAELDKQQLQAERQQVERTATTAEQQLASLQAELDEMNRRFRTVVVGLTAAEDGRQEALQQLVGMEADLAASKNWLGQIAQYHRVYAETARRHLVEVGADELDHIQEWLSGMLGREIVAPDLTRFGVTFAGARLLAINDEPVAQLVYLDADDRPLALCVIPSTGGAKSPTPSVDGELNLVDWRDDRYGYAVVGWSDPELLSTLTEAIQPVYDL
ncbi:MAG: hypothetical protein R3F54_24420 [Alphaproteobacteria bacterium]